MIVCGLLQGLLVDSVCVFGVSYMCDVWFIGWLFIHRMVCCYLLMDMLFGGSLLVVVG